MGGAIFNFFTKNRSQKHQKRAILHTSQVNGGARAPPAPPDYATGCGEKYAFALSVTLPNLTLFSRLTIDKTKRSSKRDVFFRNELMRGIKQHSKILTIKRKLRGLRRIKCDYNFEVFLSCFSHNLRLYFDCIGFYQQSYLNV